MTTSGVGIVEDRRTFVVVIIEGVGIVGVGIVEGVGIVLHEKHTQIGTVVAHGGIAQNFARITV